jgi:hypothetical protein
MACCSSAVLLRAQSRPTYDVSKFIKTAGRATASDDPPEAELRQFLFEGVDSNISPNKDDRSTRARSTATSSSSGSGSSSGSDGPSSKVHSPCRALCLTLLCATLVGIR